LPILPLLALLVLPLLALLASCRSRPVPALLGAARRECRRGGDTPKKRVCHAACSSAAELGAAAPAVALESEEEGGAEAVG